MLRFILKRSLKNVYEGAILTHHTTLDVDCPELEQKLASGGTGLDRFDITSVLDVEILPTPETPDDE